MGGGERRSTRQRTVSAALSVVGTAERAAKVQRRLAALERDADGGDPAGGAGANEDDEEYDGEAAIAAELAGIAQYVQLSKPTGPTKRKTRGMVEAKKKRAVKPFLDVLEDARLHLVPRGVATYATATARPPKASAPRRLCSVCGSAGPAACPRCGARYCSRRCATTHTETRCITIG